MKKKITVQIYSIDTKKKKTNLHRHKLMLYYRYVLSKILSYFYLTWGLRNIICAVDIILSSVSCHICSSCTFTMSGNVFIKFLQMTSIFMWSGIVWRRIRHDSFTKILKRKNETSHNINFRTIYVNNWDQRITFKIVKNHLLFGYLR